MSSKRANQRLHNKQDPESETSIISQHFRQRHKISQNPAVRVINFGSRISGLLPTADPREDDDATMMMSRNLMRRPTIHSSELAKGRKEERDEGRKGGRALTNEPTNEGEREEAENYRITHSLSGKIII